MAATLMLLLQLVVALAPLGEGREGRSMAAHVDASGPNSHYTHNEATCAACQARTLQGSMSCNTPVLPPRVQHGSGVVAEVAGTTSASPRFLPQTRAPPSLS